MAEIECNELLVQVQGLEIWSTGEQMVRWSNISRLPFGVIKHGLLENGPFIGTPPFSSAISQCHVWWPEGTIDYHHRLPLVTNTSRAWSPSYNTIRSVIAAFVLPQDWTDRIVQTTHLMKISDSFLVRLRQIYDLALLVNCHVSSWRIRLAELSQIVQQIQLQDSL